MCRRKASKASRTVRGRSRPRPRADRRSTAAASAATRPGLGSCAAIELCLLRGRRGEYDEGIGGAAFALAPPHERSPPAGRSCGLARSAFSTPDPELAQLVRRRRRSARPTSGRRPAWFFGNAIVSRRFGSLGEHHQPCGRSRTRCRRAAARPSRARRAGSRTSRAAARGVRFSSAKTRACISGLVDPERPAAELVAVADQVVGVRDRVRRDPGRSGRPTRPPAA